MQARAVDAVRRRDAAVEAEHGPDAVWVAVSHGDVIKSVLADALGMHLDLFQRHPGRPGVDLDRPLHRAPAPTCWPPTPTRATCPGWRPPAKKAPRAPAGAADAAGRRRRRARDAAFGARA